MKQGALVVAIASGLATAAVSAHASFIFGTVTPDSEFGTTEGQNATAAPDDAGSLFPQPMSETGPINDQLTSSGVSGANEQQDGQPIPGTLATTVVGAGLGQGGFALGAIYAGSQGSDTIYRVPNSATPQPFVTLPNETVRQIVFDSGSLFGGNMLVATTAGRIYRVTSTGRASLLASVGGDAQGMDIAPSGAGSFAGQLLIASENTGSILAVGPAGTVSVVATDVPQRGTGSAGSPGSGSNGMPSAGSYIASYSGDLRVGDGSRYPADEGDAIVASALRSNVPVWSLSDDRRAAPSDPALLARRSELSQEVIVVSTRGIADFLPDRVTLVLLGTAAVLLGGLRYLFRRGRP